MTTKKSKAVTISRRQLTQALKAYDGAIAYYESLIDGVKYPDKNTAEENLDLADYKKQLKKFQDGKKQLEQLQ